VAAVPVVEKFTFPALCERTQGPIGATSQTN